MLIPGDTSRPAEEPVRPGSLRRHNLGLILTNLRREGPTSRAELSDRVGLTRATVASLVEPLLSTGLLCEVPMKASGRGRPPRPLDFGPASPLLVGIGVEVDGLTACAVDLAGEVVARRQTQGDNRDLIPDRLVSLVTDTVSALLSKLRRPLGGVGLALPALLDGAGPTAVVRSAPNLPRLAGSDPGLLLATQLAVPVIVDNEATLGAVAHVGAEDSYLYISAGVGIGGGVVLHGRVFRGSRGSAGEIGHVIVDADGPPCGCGGYGCLEQYAGRPALLHAAGGFQDMSSLRAALDRGDPRASSAVTQAGAAVGVAAASAVNLLDIPTVVLGGDFIALADEIGPAVTAQLRDRALGPESPRVIVSGFGDNAGARGAAEAVWREVASDPDLLA